MAISDEEVRAAERRIHRRIMDQSTKAHAAVRVALSQVEALHARLGEFGFASVEDSNRLGQELWDVRATLLEVGPL